MSSSSEAGGFLDSLYAANPFFVHVDEDYIDDSFNLTGLRKQLPTEDADRYQEALNFVLEGGSTSSSALLSTTLKVFGLIHARFIATSRGGQLLQEKIDLGVYGSCPRYMCNGSHLLPLGLSDLIAEQQPLKLFCVRCQQLYNCGTLYVFGSLRLPLDGSFFGSSASPMVVLGTPRLLEQLALGSPEPFRLRIYGFLIHPSAAAAAAAALKPETVAPLPAAAAAAGAGKSSPDDSDHGAAGPPPPVQSQEARNQKKRERGSLTKEVQDL